MAIKKLAIDCSCATPICDHAYDKVSDMLQSGYDDGYDEGWRDAFFAIKDGLIDMGFEKARDMKLPEPPPRSMGGKKLRTSGERPEERLN